jgi:CubicO group peptidase (beta-lactamase class C family)
MNTTLCKLGLLALGCLVPVFPASERSLPAPAASQTGTSAPGGLTNEAAGRIDAIVGRYLPAYEYINIGLVQNAAIVLTRAYGNRGVDDPGVYASVSKPVTAVILMQFVAAGKIKRIDDNIWVYSKKYEHCLPAQYADSPLTFRHLLTHTSGLPHGATAGSPPIWQDEKLNLQFRPGTSYRYSTGGFGILAGLLEDISGRPFSQLLTEYIGQPVGATSFTIPGADAAGWGINSTIKDMARFGIGVMQNTYAPADLLYGQILRPSEHSAGYGLGWGVSQPDSEEIVASHSGSNGRPKAFLLLKPRKKFGVAILATSRGQADTPGLGALARELLTALEKPE